MGPSELGRQLAVLKGSVIQDRCLGVAPYGGHLYLLPGIPSRPRERPVMETWMVSLGSGTMEW